MQSRSQPSSTAVTDERLLIVSPLHNEAGHLDRTAAAVAAQERPPDRWIVVDDGSTDATATVARRWAAELPFMSVVMAPQLPVRAGQDRLALAKEARAFNIGLAAADWRGFTHIGKLDGDVELPPHWFATQLERFRADPRLGIAGGRLTEPKPAGWEVIPIPGYHVHGAVKLYRRECLAAIGGVPECLGWDTIDETYARMQGYTTWSWPDLVARHHRLWGSSGGRLRGKARHGECAWILHYSLPWTLLRTLKIARVPPAGFSGVAFAYGYARAVVRQTPQVPDPEFRRFVRRELRGRMLAALGRGIQVPGSGVGALGSVRR
jgi:poly-beta-1,6-N-acetyl-D-glucosamine synthase